MILITTLRSILLFLDDDLGHEFYGFLNTERKIRESLNLMVDNPDYAFNLHMVTKVQPTVQMA